MHEGPINWQDWKDIELAQVRVCFQHAKICSMLCSFLLGTGTGNVLLDKYGIPGSRHTAASATKALPNTRSALSSVLVIDMSWIAAWTPHQLARLAEHWTSTRAHILPAFQNLFNALVILARTEIGNVILDKYRIPGSRHTAASATKALPNTRSEVSAKLKLSQLSTLWRRQSSLIGPFARMERVKRMVLSQWSLADTCMCACALCSVLLIDMNWINAWMSYEFARLERHWTSTSDASAYILPAWQQLVNALLILALKWNRQRDSW